MVVAGTTIDILVDPSSNLPIGYAATSAPSSDEQHAMNVMMSIVVPANSNLTPAEKELLRWHYRLGHLSLTKVQFLLGLGILAPSATKRSLHRAASKIRTPPKCAACQFGKQTARSTPSTTSRAVLDRVGAISANQLLPGQQTSVDHFICSTLGRTFESRGKGPASS